MKKLLLKSLIAGSAICLAIGFTSTAFASNSSTSCTPSGAVCDVGFDMYGTPLDCRAHVNCTDPLKPEFSCDQGICYKPATGGSSEPTCPAPTDITVGGVVYTSLHLAMDSSGLAKLYKCGASKIYSEFNGSLVINTTSDKAISVSSPTAGSNVIYSEATAGNGTAIRGKSSTYIGVRGSTDSGYGVYGDASTNTGKGVYGSAASGFGVEGSSTSGNGVAGGSNTGYGVYGNATNNIGIWGNGKIGGKFTANSGTNAVTLGSTTAAIDATGNVNILKSPSTTLLSITPSSTLFGQALTGDYVTLGNPNSNCTNPIIDWVNSTTGWGLSNPPGACPLLINAGTSADINGSFPTTLSGGILTNALTTMGIMIYGPGETINSPQGGLMINTFGGGETINAIGTGGFNMASTLGGLENNGAKLGRSVEKYPVRITDGDGLSVNGPIQNTWPFPKKAAFSPDYATGTAYGFTNAQWESACTSTGGTINAYDVNNDNKTCEYPVYVKKNLNVGANTVLWSDGTVEAGDVFSTHLYGNSITSYGGINTMNSGDVHAMGSLIADGNLSVAGTTNLKVILTAPFCGFGPCICLNGGGQVLDWSSAKKCAIVGP